MLTLPDASALTGWRKSRYSNGAGAECVEVADGLPGVLPVRDSENPQGPALIVSRSAWTAFIAPMRATGSL